MSLGATQPFRPSGTVTVAGGTTPVSVKMPVGGEAVLVFNASAATAFVRFGTDLTVSASVADTPMPAGARMLLHVGAFAGTASVVLASGSGSVFITRGDGTVY